MRLIIFCGLWLLGATATATAQQITALAVSPDGATLLVAGDNRTLYTLDATTLAVTDRRYLPGQVRWITYSSDGHTIYLRAQDKSFTALDAASFKPRFSAEDVSAAAYAPESERLLLLESSYKGGVVNVVAATSGKAMRRLDMPDLRVEDAALSADGTRAHLLTKSESSDTETKEQPSSDLKGHAKHQFRQQHDGYISKLVSVDLDTGDFQTSDTWFRVNSPSQVRMLGDAAAFINGTSDSGLVQADGTANLLDLGESYVSFIRIADDGQSILLTNGSEVKVQALADSTAGEVISENKVQTNPGPGEWVTAADEAADGTIFMGTSAYRIWKLAPDGSTIDVAPVF